MKQIIDVTLFLGERGLAFQGSSQRIGDSNNGNCLCLMELLSHWDSILREHVLKVEELQKNGERLQVHYLSNETKMNSLQNVLILFGSTFWEKLSLQCIMQE